MPSQKQWIFLTLALVAIILLGLMLYYMNVPSKEKIIRIGDTPVAVEMASTEAAREQGLSSRASLPEGKGMLFVFQQDGNWGFWMKQMNFSLDILWADASGKIITVEGSLSPQTYPQVFYPSAPARYVLEVPAGFSAEHSIVVGSQLILPSANTVSN